MARQFPPHGEGGGGPRTRDRERRGWGSGDHLASWSSLIDRVAATSSKMAVATASSGGIMGTGGEVLPLLGSPTEAAGVPWGCLWVSVSVKLTGAHECHRCGSIGSRGYKGYRLRVEEGEVERESSGVGVGEEL